MLYICRLMLYVPHLALSRQGPGTSVLRLTTHLLKKPTSGVPSADTQQKVRDPRIWTSGAFVRAGSPRPRKFVTNVSGVSLSQFWASGSLLADGMSFSRCSGRCKRGLSNTICSLFLSSHFGARRESRISVSSFQLFWVFLRGIDGLLSREPSTCMTHLRFSDDARQERMNGGAGGPKRLCSNVDM